APPAPGIHGGLAHPSAPHAGVLFVQGTVAGRPFDDAHGAGWRLVTIDPEAAAIGSAAREWFESIGGRVVVLTDPDPTYQRWFAEHGATSALQRPDFHLYGAATTPDAAAALLDDLRDNLTDLAREGVPR